MTTLEIILTIVYILVGALSVGIPSLIKLIKSARALKDAKTEAEKAKAIADMNEQMEILAQAAEIAYKDVHATLKAQGSSAGLIKKDSVMIKLQNYAVEKGYPFDAEFWSDKLTKYIESTRNINVK